MSQYLLQAGNTPALTLAEAQAVVDPQAELLGQAAVKFEAENDQQAQELFKLLGGAVKLVKVAKTLAQEKQSKLEGSIVELLTADSPASVQFGVGYWGEQLDDKPTLMSIKQALQDKNIKARFLEGKNDGLGAALLLNQEVKEVIVFHNQDQLALGITLAVQDIDHWTMKDRQKPYADRKKGMLPPKLARIMVNLALGKNAQDKLVYDPFCGTGTTLIEALELGAQVVGSDLDEDAVIGTQTNLAWFAEQAELEPNFSTFQSQVAQATANQLSGKANALVTEPFLGKPNPQEKQLPGMFKGLEKLYLGAFKQWRSLLNEGARLVIIFPRVETQSGKVFDLQSFVDKSLPQGYTLQVDWGSLRYHRQGATVQRDIAVFEYSSRQQSNQESK